ncbi:MAG TPA: spermidine/putrescine ABC transporter substrate-binding protein [Gemmatimonadales bacterium]|jgi:spermidine/putrescine transport system substrate-binding protein
MTGDNGVATRAASLATRRAFIGACGRSGISVAGASLLWSCVTRRDPPPPDERAITAAGPLERELRIFNWSDYIAAETVSRFEQEFGVRVTYDTYESNEEMVAKLVAGGDGYDIIAPSGYLVPVLIEGNLIQPLDHRVLSNWSNLLPLFADAGADRGRYAMPYQWGMTGVAFRRDLVAAVPGSWAAFADRHIRGEATMLDDGREVLGAMLKWRGHSVNSTDRRELEAARDDALRVKPNLRAYLSATVKGQLISGDIAVAQLWSGDTRQAQREEGRIDFVVPAEGSLLFCDYLAIPRAAPNRRAAHAFLNYVLRPDVAAEIAEQTGYGPANGAAVGRMAHPVEPPGADLLARLEFQRDLGAATDLWDRLWTEVKVG